MISKPIVSIIVPTYNRKWLLPRTLNSLVQQTYKNLEVILVNDAGEDVDEVAEEYKKLLNLRYIKNFKNIGLAGTRNVGMKNAIGDYFIFLDDDDILLPLAVEFRLEMMEKYNAQIVYTRALQDIWRLFDKGYGSIHKQLYWDCPFDRDLILVQNIAPCNCVMFSRKAWNESGFYNLDEVLKTGEDYDFWIALSRKNDFKELLLVDCECTFREDKTQMSGSRNFSADYPRIYKKWRNHADNKETVIERQNASLEHMGIKPKDYGL